MSMDYKDSLFDEALSSLAPSEAGPKKSDRRKRDRKRYQTKYNSKQKDVGIRKVTLMLPSADVQAFQALAKIQRAKHKAMLMRNMGLDEDGKPLQS